MARGINKVIIVGNLGADPEVRYGASGNAVTKISVATTDQWKDKQTGQKQERTEWHRVTFFGRLAEIAGEYLRKGSQVYLEGSLRTDKYTDKQGIERWSTDIIANEMQMLGGRGDNGGGGNYGGGGGRGAPSQGGYGGGQQQQGGWQNQNNQTSQQQKPADNAFNQDVGFDDDDIPF